MKHGLAVVVSIQLVLFTSVISFAIPKTMAVDLHPTSEGVYTSEVFHVPVRICNATLDISLLTDTFFRATLELRVGEDYIHFHLNDLSISGHFEHDIFELFARVTSRDVALTLFIDTDGIIQGMPQVSMTYYGFW